MANGAATQAISRSRPGRSSGATVLANRGRKSGRAYLTPLLYVPDGDRLFEHDAEGPDDMPAHVRSALTATQLSVPVIDGRLALGTWQGIYLYEHRTRGQRREVVLHLIGE